MLSINRYSLWRILATAIALLWIPNQLYAFGDYRLKIDDDYAITRANELQVSLSRISTHDLVYYCDMFPATGPIDCYKVTPTHIFLWVYGRKPRNHFPGDKFEDVDWSNKSYLILDKSNQQLIGPLNQADFQAHPIVQSFGKFSWIEARNPDPVEGFHFLLFCVALVHGGPVFLIALVLIATVLLLFQTKLNSRNGPEALNGVARGDVVQDP